MRADGQLIVAFRKLRTRTSRRICVASKTHDGEYLDELCRPVERLVTEGIACPRSSHGSL